MTQNTFNTIPYNKIVYNSVKINLQELEEILLEVQSSLDSVSLSLERYVEIGETQSSQDILLGQSGLIEDILDTVDTNDTLNTVAEYNVIIEETVQISDNTFSVSDVISSILETQTVQDNADTPIILNRILEEVSFTRDLIDDTSISKIIILLDTQGMIDIIQINLTKFIPTGNKHVLNVKIIERNLNLLNVERNLKIR